MATKNLRQLARLSVVALFAFGCADATTGRDPVDAIEDPTLSAVVLSASASPGEIVQVRFRNTGSTQYWFGSCGRAVERSVGGAWVRLPDELRVCTAEVHGLAPGGELVRSVDIPADAADGQYRFAFHMMPDLPDAAGVTLKSTSFQVR